MSAQLCCGLARLDTASDPTRAKEEREKARRQVVQAVRAKYDEAQWLNLAKPLRDVLRERQRAALVAYLAAHLRVPLTVWEQPHPVLPQDDHRPAVKELQQKLNVRAGASPRC